MTGTSYDPNEIVTDGPYTAPRKYQHAIKVLIALAVYATMRDGWALDPWLAAVIASPAFMLVVTIAEWIRPTDPAEHRYALALRVDDFITDWSCTFPAIVLACLAHRQFAPSIGVTLLGAAGYLLCRKNARP